MLKEKKMNEKLNVLSNPVNPIKFSESFWGDKFNGWEVLYKNFRSSLAAVKEFEVYLRECASTEDNYVKNLDKIKFQILKFSTDSTISPIWHNIFKDLNKNNSGVHLHFKYRIEELIKEIQNYYEDLKLKKHKIKENDAKTQQLIELIKISTLNLTKSKELYSQSCTELEKYLNETQSQNSSSSSVPASSPNLGALNMHQKLEKKCQLLKEEYQTSIDKYNTVRIEYEQRFTESCNLFQAEEELYLQKMRTYIMNYTQLLAQLNSSRQKNFSDCQQKLTNVYTNEILLQKLVLTKSTGQERLPEIQQIETSLDTFSNKASSQLLHQISFDSPQINNDESKANEHLENEESPISSSMPANFTPKQSIRNSRGFSIIDMLTRKLNSSENNKKNLTRNPLSGSFSFLPNIFHPSNREELKSCTDLDEEIGSNTNSKAAAIIAVSDAFDQPLKQIESLEFNKKEKKVTSDPLNITEPKKMNNEKNRISFALKESPIIPKKPEKPTVLNVGSLMTATSLDNTFFDNSSFFENIDDYIDSLHTPSNNHSVKIEIENKQIESFDNLYAFSETSDEESKLPLSAKQSKNTSSVNIIENNLIDNDQIEENDVDLNDSDDNDSDDDDSDDSDAPKKLNLIIKPLSQSNLNTNPDVLREEGKLLKLRPYSYIEKRIKFNQTINNGNNSLTSISSINNILQQSTSPSFSSDRDASRSASALNTNNKEEQTEVITTTNNNKSLDENNNLNENVFQMDKELNSEVEHLNNNIAPPLPPLTLSIKQKYLEILNKKQLLFMNNNKSDSFENISYDSDLSMNNSPIMDFSMRLKIEEESYAKF